jgi:hypothetical protein
MYHQAPFTASCDPSTKTGYVSSRQAKKRGKEFGSTIIGKRVPFNLETALTLPARIARLLKLTIDTRNTDQLSANP